MIALIASPPVRRIGNQRPQDKINVNNMMIGALPSCRALIYCYYENVNDFCLNK